MNIKYKISYLTNGTKVKITNELFNQLKKWESEKIQITDFFKDELKKQDNNWINKNRQYQRKNISLESLMPDGNEYIFIDTSAFIEKLLIRKELLQDINSILNLCTKTQRRRFVLYFAYGMSHKEIAEKERCNESNARKSIEKAIEMLINREHYN